MNTEIWKSITGYEGLYEISNLGRIKSLNYNHTGREKIIKPKNNKGYLRVDLRKDGKHKLLYVHRLVATAFLPNPEGFKQVNHRDEVKTNNCVENLEFCDAKYNSNYGTRNVRIGTALSKPVEASKYPDFREIFLRFPSTAEAGRNGYQFQNVSACCNGRYHREGNNKYKGLYWRFAV